MPIVVYLAASWQNGKDFIFQSLWRVFPKSARAESLRSCFLDLLSKWIKKIKRVSIKKATLEGGIKSWRPQGGEEIKDVLEAAGNINVQSFLQENMNKICLYILKYYQVIMYPLPFIIFSRFFISGSWGLLMPISSSNFRRVHLGQVAKSITGK